MVAPEPPNPQPPNREELTGADGVVYFPRAKMPSSRRFHGAMTGLAVGDALGAIVEFKQPGRFEPVTGMRPSEAHAIPAGAFTDDASTALCLAWSLIENDLAIDQRDQMERYVRWYRDGYMSSTGECFDIGNGTRAALEGFEASGDPEQGKRLTSAGGAGALARLAPVAICTRQNRFLIERAAQCTLTTHGAPEAIDASRLFAAMLSHALWAADGEDLNVADLKREITGFDLPWFRYGLGEHEWHELLRPITTGSFKELAAEDIADRGYVVTALESALWALHNSESFEEGMLLAVNLGLDADTRGAIFGQLAGAIYGMESIPKEWREGLVMEEEFRGVTSTLAVNMLHHVQRAQEEMLK